MSTEVARLEPQEYFAAPGLSQSALKDLAISPLRYWFLHVNPNAPLIEPSPEMIFGNALHCALLESDQFDSRYACELIPPDDCLDTIEDLRTWLRSKGVTPKGTRKDEVIAQCLAVPGEAPHILQVMKARHAEVHAGKTIIKAEDWQRIKGCGEALIEEPRVVELLKQGQSEVPFFRKDLDTGVLLKGKLDWVTPKATLDIKTFAQKMNRSIDESVNAAIYYEKYHWQAYTYAILRGYPQEWRGDHVLAFVESEPPHETRIRAIRPTISGGVSLLWEQARIKVRDLIRLYAECLAHFGTDRPWRYAQEISQIVDEEVPGLAWER